MDEPGLSDGQIISEVELAWRRQRLHRALSEAHRPGPEPFDWKRHRREREELVGVVRERWRLFPYAFMHSPVDEL